ncbi:MAG: arylsulfatase [Opitutaceae bacterium]|jgi:arylsulfatase A-like enzyme|nr:arylsulfatase [Opitutaceae bacterium]
MKTNTTLACSLAALGLAATSQSAGAATATASAPAPEARKPNIIYILADDMGLGDVSAYNPNAAWKTPGIDRLAREGTRFTDAHSSSAVCTPSRYSILTGRYNWRSARKSGVGGGLSEPMLEPKRATVASFLKQNGYTTAMIGKWHLGLDWTRRGGNTSARDKDRTNDGEKKHRRPSGEQAVDYTKPFGGGPTAHGFDYFLGISASLDMPPYVWLRNNRADPSSFPLRQIQGNDDAQKLWRTGAAGKTFAHIDVLPHLANEAVRYVAAQRGDKPFFLYLALTAPHTPIFPTTEFAGRTQTTGYGDFCAQVDAVVNNLLTVIAAKGFDKNTIVIFATDNGCSPSADFKSLAKYNHDPNLGMRGHKADIYEGGHHVPFIVRWPGRVLANHASNELMYQGDLFATCADIIGAKIPANAAEDSVSILPALTGEKPGAPLHEAIVHHSNNGSFAIRQGAWKLILCPDSGGWSQPRPGHAPRGAPPFQLFNLEQDPSEKTNLHKEHPEMVQRLGKLLIKYIRDGRSTPGPAQKNTGGNNWPELAWMKQFK